MRMFSFKINRNKLNLMIVFVLLILSWSCSNNSVIESESGISEEILYEIILVGESSIELFQGEDYSDEGAFVFLTADNTSGILIFSDIKVDTSRIGVYNLIYKYEFLSGIKSKSISRIVEVIEPLPLKKLDFGTLKNNYSMTWGMPITFTLRDVVENSINSGVILRGQYSGRIPFNFTYSGSVLTLKPLSPIRANEIYTIELNKKLEFTDKSISSGLTTRFKFMTNNDNQIFKNSPKIINSDFAWTVNILDFDNNGSINFITDTTKQILIENNWEFDYGIQVLSPESRTRFNEYSNSFEYTSEPYLGKINSFYPSFVGVLDLLNNNINWVLFSPRTEEFEIDHSILYGYNTEYGLIELYRGLSGPVIPDYDKPYRDSNHISLILLDNADINHDGYPDLLILEQNTWKADLIVLLLSNFIEGKIQYIPKLVYSTGVGLNGFFVDWDNDDDLDIVLTNGTLIYIENKNGEFRFPMVLDYGNYSPRIFIHNDFDNDGRSDVLTVIGNSSIYISYNRGETVETELVYSSDEIFIITSLTVGDLDGDGNSDIIFAKQPNNTIDAAIIYLLRNVDNKFGKPEMISNESRGSIRFLNLVDLENNGSLELIYQNNFGLNRR